MSVVCGKSAVTMFDTSSTVENTDANEGEIIGPFFPSIDCNKQASSKVTGIRIEGSGFELFGSGKTVTGNIIMGASGTPFESDAARSPRTTVIPR